jgi:hypothetical protein
VIQFFLDSSLLHGIIWGREAAAIGTCVVSSAKELRANADECLDRDKATWRIVAKDLKEAAVGGDPAEVLLALRMALSLEGVECRSK